METGPPLSGPGKRSRTLQRIKDRLWKPGRRLPVIVLAADLLVFLLTLWARANPDAVETTYATGIYPVIAAVLGAVSDLVPFSLQEILIAAAVLSPLFVLVRGLIRRKRGRTGRNSLSGFLRRMLLAGGIVYAVFYPVWGFNYFRLPLTAHDNFDTTRLTPENFDRLLAGTMHEVNAWAGASPGLEKEDWQRRQVLLDRSITAAGGVPIRAARRLKHFASGVFELFPYTGVTLPFLMEAHLACDLFPWEAAFIGMHERTHLAGYTRESEANFFAYLALRSSPEAGDRYAAALSLLRYLAASLPIERRLAILATLAPRALADLHAASLRQFRKSSLLREASRFVYDRYLRSNAIVDGIADYQQVVRLLLAYRHPQSVPF